MGGSIKVLDLPNNPFKVREKQLPAPAYTSNINQSIQPYQQNNPYQQNKPYQQNSPSQTYKANSPHMQKQPTATLNIFPPQPAKPQTGLEVSHVAPMPFAPNDMNKYGFPKFYDPYGPKMHEQYYNIGGPHSLPIGFVKNYNIYPDSINEYQTKLLPIIYEDSIPLRGAKHELTTLSERHLLYEYLKNNLVSYEEGEEGCLNHNGGINLLRQLKYLSPHPVNYSLLYTNPLHGLRKGIRIYRSCYPITTDRGNRTICYKNSLGLHIKFYNKNYFENNTGTMNDMTRELAFYKWIRANILLKNKCPNFVMLYTYNNCATCDEPFNTLDKSKIVRPMPSPFTLNTKPGNMLTSRRMLNTKCLIVITEAPNMNLLEWMTNERTYGINKKTHNRYGYHSSEVWLSVYFQIFAAMYILDKNKIYITDFGYDNIWIKDIPAVGYWEYIIENITYYVPNCGYLVMIDCSFQMKLKTLNSPCIESPNIYKSSNSTPTVSSTTQWENIFSQEPFGRGLINTGVRLPPANMIDKIKKCDELYKTTKYELSNIILTTMTELLHRRIGEELTSDELLSISSQDDSYHLDLQNYKKGDMVAYLPEGSSITYIWGLFLGDNQLCINKTDILNPKTISESDIKKTNLNPRNIWQSTSHMIYNIDYSSPALATYEL